MTSTFANVVMRRDLLRELTLAELRSSASESRLGWVWWLIDPLVTMLIYWFVVVGILGRGQQWAPYPVFILCALLPFKHFSGALSSACKLLRSREGLIKSVPFPTMILPLSQVLSGFGYFLFGMAVLLATAWIWGRPITPALAQLPALMACQILLTAGVAMAVSAWGALVRDLSGFMGHAQRILFYLSPTLYGVDLVQERFGKGALAGSGVLPWPVDVSREALGSSLSSEASRRGFDAGPRKLAGSARAAQPTSAGAMPHRTSSRGRNSAYRSREPTPTVG